MKIKQIEKAAKILEKIKALDADIIEIEKYAMLVAEKDVEIDFTMSFKGAAQEAESKVQFDEDGSLVSKSSIEYMMRRYMTPFSFGCDLSMPKKEDKQTFGCIINENAGLQILGVLLQQKQALRSQLINSLNKIGITI